VADTPLTEQNWADRREVTDSLLAILPDDRLLSVRYPLLKSTFYGFDIPTDSLTAAEAHSGSIKSRIGYHNDCFLVAANDYTFGNTTTEKPYWETESRYTIMGGESCGDTPEFTNCQNALTDLENAHWTYLNDYYHPDVLDRWEQEGCLGEVRRRLGYRLSLLSGIFPEQVSPGEALAFSLDIQNEGFAAPVNARPSHLILRSMDDEYVFDLSIDVRQWYGGGTYTHNFSIDLPGNMPSGNYQFYLHFPDAALSLSADPRFALRLANLDIWEAATGYHDLRATVAIAPPNSLTEEKDTSPNFTVSHTGAGAYTIQSEISSYDLRLLDVTGRTVRQFSQLSGDYSFSLADQAQGVYLLILRSTQDNVFKVVRIWR
jgi:hypothetical protein